MTDPRILRRAQAGFSLVEVMVGLLLGLIATLAMVQSFTGSEMLRQAATGRADAHQAGALSHWRLGRQLRLAGAGLGHAAGFQGCALQARRGAAVLLPSPAAWPQPFGNLPQALTLTPLAVNDNAGPGGSDQIVLMSGLAGASAVPSPAVVASAALLQVGGAVGFNPGDLLLVSSATAGGPCMIGQIDETYAPAVASAPAVMLPTSTAGAPFNGPAGFTALPAPGDYEAISLGQSPMINFFGLNADAELVVFDPLRIYTAGESVPLAGDVVQLQVVYGVDNGAGGLANDNIVDAWVAPTGAYAFAAMSAAGGNAALQVKAVRVAMVVRSRTPNTGQAPASITLFPDLPPGVQTQINLSDAQRRFGHQVIDSVIPLRNQTSALCAEFRRRLGVPANGACT